MSKRFIGVKELADLLSVHPNSIYRNLEAIPHISVGKAIRFDMESPAMQQWLTKGTKEEGAA
jgi:hypothetical protein